MKWAGMIEIPTKLRTRSEASWRTLGDFMICTAMYGSGARIGTMSITMRTVRRRILADQVAVNRACFVVVRGIATIITVVAPTAEDMPPIVASTATVFEW